MICPYCLFPLTGNTALKKLTKDSFSLVRVCCHCEAILRFDITTLKPPKEDFRINKPKGRFVSCKLCDETINLDGKPHECSGVSTK